MRSNAESTQTTSAENMIPAEKLRIVTFHRDFKASPHQMRVQLSLSNAFNWQLSCRAHYCCSDAPVRPASCFPQSTFTQLQLLMLCLTESVSFLQLLVPVLPSSLGICLAAQLLVSAFPCRHMEGQLVVLFPAVRLPTCGRAGNHNLLQMEALTCILG